MTNFDKRTIIINRIGQKFGKLTVIDFAGCYNKTTWWLCRCDCGREKEINGRNLVSGRTKGCGCYKNDPKYRERMRKLSLKHGEGTVGHLTPEYRAWSSMHTRCYNPHSQGYKYWGGRGIGICAEWKDDYLKFLSDMGRMPKKGYTLDRVDNNGDYSEENCRWITKAQQASNRSNSQLFNGETSAAAARRIGITRQAIMFRIKNGWPRETAFNLPCLPHGITLASI